MFIWNFFLKLTDTITSQDIDLSSWIILYKEVDLRHVTAAIIVPAIQKYALGLASLWSVDGLCLYHQNGLSYIDQLCEGGVRRSCRNISCRTATKCFRLFLLHTTNHYLSCRYFHRYDPYRQHQQESALSALIDLHSMRMRRQKWPNTSHRLVKQVTTCCLLLDVLVGVYHPVEE